MKLFAVYNVFVTCWNSSISCKSNLGKYIIIGLTFYVGINNKFSNIMDFINRYWNNEAWYFIDGNRIYPLDCKLFYCPTATVYLKKYAHGFCFAVFCCGYTLIFPYPSGLLHCHCGNLTIAPVPAKQPWWIWINTSCEFIMNDCITTTKQSTTKPCAYFLGYSVFWSMSLHPKYTGKFSNR